jgi:hypothetical protein
MCIEHKSNVLRDIESEEAKLSEIIGTSQFMTPD